MSIFAIISSLFGLTLVFLGGFGISDLRDPNQFYCIEGDKNRNHRITFALYSTLVLVGFIHICSTVTSIILSCYTLTRKTYSRIDCNENIEEFNSEITDIPITRPPGD